MSAYSKIVDGHLVSWPPGQKAWYQAYIRDVNDRNRDKPKRYFKAEAIRANAGYVHTPFDDSSSALLHSATEYLLLPGSHVREMVDGSPDLKYYLIGNSSYMTTTFEASNKLRLEECVREICQALLSDRQRSLIARARGIERRALTHADGSAIKYSVLVEVLGLEIVLLCISAVPGNACGGVTALEGAVQDRLMGTPYGESRLFHCPMGYSGEQTPAKAYYLYLVKATKPMPQDWQIFATTNGNARPNVPALPSGLDYATAPPPAGIEQLLILRGPNDTDDSMMKQFQDLYNQGRLAQREGKMVAGCWEVNPRFYFEWRWSEWT